MIFIKARLEPKLSLKLFDNENVELLYCIVIQREPENSGVIVAFFLLFSLQNVNYKMWITKCELQSSLYKNFKLQNSKTHF